jgi:hypothetical protein
VGALKDCAKKLIKDKPYGVEYLAAINRITPIFDIRETNANAEGVDNVLAQWALPSEVNEFLKYIIFSEKLHYQTFELNI